MNASGKHCICTCICNCIHICILVLYFYQHTCVEARVGRWEDEFSGGKHWQALYLYLYLYLYQHSVYRGLGRKQLFSVKQASGALKLKLDPLYVCISICICNCISICNCVYIFILITSAQRK